MSTDLKISEEDVRRIEASIELATASVGFGSIVTASLTPRKEGQETYMRYTLIGVDPQDRPPLQAILFKATGAEIKFRTPDST